MRRDLTKALLSFIDIVMGDYFRQSVMMHIAMFYVGLMKYAA